ncbi:MAG TPA: hypothetical protein VL463_05005 [Kofleriaceae bacterium]|nr:hypothetical protein [Kofleriaceae bacterium]
MRQRAVVVMALVWAVACGKVHTLEDGGAPDAKAVDANATSCATASCSATADGCCPTVCNASNDPDCPAVCDNGAIENGETCDPLASCPTDCPTIGCQKRTLDQAGTCAAACVNGDKITLCSESSDGCCPTGCNASNDLDCAATCDNGVLEPGEKCDPLASCPTSCPQQGCNLYTLFDAGTCQAQCVLSGQQSACANNDGCCPGGCNANNDNDCQPKCNNGVLESGETCDPLASCPTSCPQQGCNLYTLSNAGTCQAQCDSNGQQTACVNNDGCCPGACNANNDNDCQPTCNNGVIEAGETCDPISTCVCPGEAFTCYTTTGSAQSCDLVCHVPQEKCGVAGDSCCAFDTTGGCDSNTDKECAGPKWQFARMANYDTSNGCQTHRLAGFVAGGSYLFTTCAPTAIGAGTGDPYFKSITDDKGNALTGGADNCSDPTALPNLLPDWTCKGPSGLVMTCSPMNPGGFIMKTTPAFVDVVICPVKPGAGPFYIWYNATTPPHEG